MSHNADEINLDNEGNNVLHLLLSKVHPIYKSEVIDYVCENNLISLFSQRNNVLLTPLQYIRSISFLNLETLQVLELNGIALPLVSTSLKEDLSIKHEDDNAFDNNLNSDTSGSDSDY